jgi:hypothetical protein
VFALVRGLARRCLKWFGCACLIWLSSSLSASAASGVISIAPLSAGGVAVQGDGLSGDGADDTITFYYYDSVGTTLTYQYAPLSAHASGYCSSPSAVRAVAYTSVGGVAPLHFIGAAQILAPEPIASPLPTVVAWRNVDSSITISWGGWCTPLVGPGTPADHIVLGVTSGPAPYGFYGPPFTVPFTVAGSFVIRAVSGVSWVAFQPGDAAYSVDSRWQYSPILANDPNPSPSIAPALLMGQTVEQATGVLTQVDRLCNVFLLLVGLVVLRRWFA